MELHMVRYKCTETVTRLVLSNIIPCCCQKPRKIFQYLSFKTGGSFFFFKITTIIVVRFAGRARKNYNEWYT